VYPLKCDNKSHGEQVTVSKTILPVLVLFVVLSGVTFIVALTVTALAQLTPTSLPTYSNSTYGIKFQYPPNWDKVQNGTKLDTETDIVTFYPPASTSNASLDVSTDNISDERGVSVAQYSSEGLSDLKQSLKNFKLIESTTNNVLATLPAYKLVYTYLDGNTILKDMEIGAIKGDKAYIITYEGGAGEYDKYLPSVQKMIDSFQITK
jgi:serine/threonine-protein kinase